METTSDSLTRKLFLTFLFIRIFSSLQLSSDKTMQTVSFRRLPVKRNQSKNGADCFSRYHLMLLYLSEELCHLGKAATHPFWLGTKRPRSYRR